MQHAGDMFLVNVLVNLLSNSIFSQFLQGLCFHVMPCSFQLVPNFLVKNAFLEIGFFFFFFFFFLNFICIFHNSKIIQCIWMELYRDVDPDDQARCTQVA